MKINKTLKALDSTPTLALAGVEMSSHTQQKAYGTQQNDYIFAYICISSQLIIQICYNVQTDKTTFVVMKNAKEMQDKKVKKLITIDALDQITDVFCQLLSDKKETKVLIECVKNSMPVEIQKTFPKFLYECEMIIKQKNKLQKSIPKEEKENSSGEVKDMEAYKHKI